MALPADLKIDGLDLTDFLKGAPAPRRECFYWELHEGPVKQAVRFGNWKVVRNGPKGAVELYDLDADPAEKNDLAASRPKQVKEAVALMAKSRTAHPDWPVPASWGAKPQ